MVGHGEPGPGVARRLVRPSVPDQPAVLPVRRDLTRTAARHGRATGSAGRTSTSLLPASETAPSASRSGTSASAIVSAAPSAGNVRAYALAGGNVTLDVTGGSVQLVTAVPAAGYSVQTWSGTDWLRVDFSSGPQVSSLIASWYQHAPAITVTN